jgi:hypothetical protein
MKIFSFVFCLMVATISAQGVTIGSGTPPDPSAALDIQSTTGGLLPPRLSTVERNAILTPAAGLCIYNVDNDCIESYFVQGGWKAVQCGCNAFPNAQFSVPSASINGTVTLQSPVPNMAYSWTFQNGNPGTASVQNPQVVWSSAGTFGITLTLTDSAGCSATFTDSIVVSLCTPQTFSFTTCGQTGRFGPTQNQCNSTYGAGVVTVQNGIQRWVVPQSGTYRIEIAGAQGGGHLVNGTPGGRGATLRADVTLNAGTTLDLLVGQEGLPSLADNINRGGGGGGGSFVANGSTPVIVAGGGGGRNYGSAAAGDGRTFTSGGAGGTTAGGTNGNGGTVAAAGHGGGGFLTGSFDSGQAFLNGGVGTQATHSLAGDGGFGGGGASANQAGGGGGGYSGGGSGTNSSTSGFGGGGGSFIISTAVNVSSSNGQYEGSSQFNGNAIVNNGALQTGAGFITITRICP